MPHAHRITSAVALALTALAGSWLAACAGEDDPATRSSGGTTETSTPMTTGEIDPGLQPYIDLAVADLAERTSAAAADITVQSATLVVWPDAALGCPSPGQQYAQVTSDGSLIVLVLDGREFRYHAGGSRLPFLCEPPGKSLTSDPTTTL